MVKGQEFYEPGDLWFEFADTAAEAVANFRREVGAVLQ